MNQIKEAFQKVKNDLNEMKSEIVKLADRLNDLAIDVENMKKKKKA